MLAGHYQGENIAVESTSGWIANEEKVEGRSKREIDKVHIVIGINSTNLNMEQCVSLGENNNNNKSRRSVFYRFYNAEKEENTRSAPL